MTTTTVAAPTSTVTKPPTTGPVTLQPGARGPEVDALQTRLDALGYWLGPIDGTYGTGTTHAVTAFQKATGLGRDGVAGPATLAALDHAPRPRPASATGHLIEVDLRRQLLIVADGGRASRVLDASTGVVPGTTPTGHYRIGRRVDGWDNGPYGPLYRPAYFQGGVAVHGYPSVPPTAASHGCVRITLAAIDQFWADGTVAVGTPVWVY